MKMTYCLLMLNAKSAIRQSITLGQIAVVLEQIFFNNGCVSQCVLSAYQLKQNLIASVTYYAAAHGAS
jgi:hypothetical protein